MGILRKAPCPFLHHSALARESIVCCNILALFAIWVIFICKWHSVTMSQMLRGCVCHSTTSELMSVMEWCEHQHILVLITTSPPRLIFQIFLVWVPLAFPNKRIEHADSSCIFASELRPVLAVTTVLLCLAPLLLLPLTSSPLGRRGLRTGTRKGMQRVKGQGYQEFCHPARPPQRPRLTCEVFAAGHRGDGERRASRCPWLTCEVLAAGHRGDGEEPHDAPGSSCCKEGVTRLRVVAPCHRVEVLLWLRRRSREKVNNKESGDAVYQLKVGVSSFYV